MTKKCELNENHTGHYCEHCSTCFKCIEESAVSHLLDRHAISQVRKQLGKYNDDSQPVEWCAQNMRLELERLEADEDSDYFNRVRKG